MTTSPALVHTQIVAPFDPAQERVLTPAADQLMRELHRAPQFIEFLTIPAYQRILNEGS